MRSHGLQAFRDYLADFIQGDEFTTLRDDASKVSEGLTAARYCLHIKGSRVTVSRYDGQGDYSAEIAETFSKFKQGPTTDRRIRGSRTREMNDVEARVLEVVARLYPDAFSALSAYCERNHHDFLDATITTFDREVQFYLGLLEYAERLRSAGLPMCYPRVSDGSKAVGARDTFDIALADKLLPDGLPVGNDFFLEGPERIIVVSGPNQGGKTTFARTFGQLHHLAGIGALVPGSEAHLYLCDELFTHFERKEDSTTLHGKLEDELVRIHQILERATTGSIVIMNESFTSTTLRDALVLGAAVMTQMIECDLLAVYVTVVDELASLRDSTVSMISTVIPDDPASRTFKIVRGPADGRAYATALAHKYGLTADQLRERMAL